jgi:hypothetical protein
MTTPQKKTITPEIVIAYTQCPHKAFLLLNASDHGAPNDYIQLFTRKKMQYDSNISQNFRNQMM